MKRPKSCTRAGFSSATDLIEQTAGISYEEVVISTFFYHLLWWK